MLEEGNPKGQALVTSLTHGAATGLRLLRSALCPWKKRKMLGKVGWERNSRGSTVVLGVQGVPWDRGWWGVVLLAGLWARVQAPVSSPLINCMGLYRARFSLWQRSVLKERLIHIVSVVSDHGWKWSNLCFILGFNSVSCF